MIKDQSATAGIITRRKLLKDATIVVGSTLAAEPIPAASAVAASTKRFGKFAKSMSSEMVPAPPWLKDLIIYEIAPRGFTSPNGPQSGTFRSLRAKLPYLQELGINAIWLAGYSWGDPHHFYNIWTQYACIEPDIFDPALGNALEFSALIHDAHQRGIKIILDVITHGLMHYSPIVKAHPHWFKGGSWRMADYDWLGGHRDLDDWWVNIYTNFVVQYGVDGFRLDVDIFRPDLWDRIRHNAAAAGHPVVIFAENETPIRGITDFEQRQNVLYPPPRPVNGYNPFLLSDLPGYFDRVFGKGGYYHVTITYAKGKTAWGSTSGGGALSVRVKGLVTGSYQHHAGPSSKPDGLPHVRLELAGLGDEPIQEIIVRNDMAEQWSMQGHRGVGDWWTRPLIVRKSTASRHALDIYVPTTAWGDASIQMSCHDNGWQGFPLDKNPYTAQGSRSIFGYSCLLSPMIPIFFSGEEFNATFHPLPGLSPFLFGGGDPGKGRWLYGCQIDWAELDQPSHHAMFVDAKKIISIRKSNADILAACPANRMPNLKRIPCRGNIPIPAPYLRWNRRAAILVIANQNTAHDATYILSIQLKDIGLGGHAAYSVTDLWSTGASRMYTEEGLAKFAGTVRRDKIEGGGLAVLKIEPQALIK